MESQSSLSQPPDSAFTTDSSHQTEPVITQSDDVTVVGQQQICALLVLPQSTPHAPIESHNIVQTLQYIARQERQLDAVVVVARDQISAELLSVLPTDLFDVGILVAASALAPEVFTTATQALTAAAQTPHDDADGTDSLTLNPDPSNTWWWLLDTNCRPQADHISGLLDVVNSRPDAGLVAPKALHHAQPDLITSFGHTATRGGRIVPLVTEPEPDQGQYDHIEDVLAPSTFGFIVRRDLVTATAHTAPPVTTSGAIAHLGLAIRRSGHAVVQTPHAVVHQDEPQELPRRDQIGLALVQKPTWLAVLLVLYYAITSCVRLVTWTILKDPKRGVGDFLAFCHTMRHGPEISQARRNSLQVSPSKHQLAWQDQELTLSIIDGLRFHRDRWRAAFYPDRPRAQRSQPELTWPHIGAWALVATTIVVAGAWFWHDVVFRGTAHGGALGAGFGTAEDLWQGAIASWSADGTGATLWQPALAFWAGAVALSGHNPDLLVSIVLVGTPLLATICMWHATRVFCSALTMRMVFTLIWAGSVIATEALSTGQLSQALGIAVLPLPVAWLVRETPARSGAQQWRVASRVGLTIAVIGLLDPLLGAALALAGASCVIRSRYQIIVRCWFVLVAASTTVVQALLAWRTGEPQALWAAPGHPVTTPAAAPWAWFLGVHNAETSWQVPAWFNVSALAPYGPYLTGGVLFAVAVIGTGAHFAAPGSLLRVLGRLWLLIGCAVVLHSLVSSTMLAKTPTGVVYASSLGLAALVGVAISFMALRAFVVWARALRGTRFTRVVPAVLTLVGVVATTQFVATGWVRSPVLSGGYVAPEWTLPLAAHDAALSPDRTRTARISWHDDQYRIQVIAGGERSMAHSDPVADRRKVTLGDHRMHAQMHQVVGELIIGQGDIQESLRRLGIGFVSVSDPKLPAVLTAQTTDQSPPERLAAALAATAGLVPVATEPGLHAWRVQASTDAADGTAHRTAIAYVVHSDGQTPTPLAADAHGAVQVTLPAGAPGRRLVVAHSADDRWTATLNDQTLPKITMYGWAQGFNLPPDGGTLQLARTDHGSRIIQAGFLVLLLAGALGALPALRPRNRHLALKGQR